MLALHLRLCAAFTSTPAVTVMLQQTRTATGAVRSCGGGRRGCGATALPLGPRPPALMLAMRAATGAAASTESEMETEEAGQQSRSDDGGVDERYLMRAERKRRRKLAREARTLNVGRAKNVRRAGSSTETAGLEVLHPPQGPPGSGAPALSGLPDLSRPFTVLGIETSCDDTAAAVVRSDGAVLGEAIAGQAEIHEEWGGVVPGLARDSHALKMDGVVERALDKAGLASAAEVDAVAVTVGPGLEICLRVGAEKAKALAAQHGKPFVAVHHLEAHSLLARKAFPPTPAADVTTYSVATSSSSDTGPIGTSSAPGGDVSAAAVAASAAPSSESFAAAFTSAVTDASIPSKAGASAAPGSPPSTTTSSAGGVSAAVNAASSAPSSEAFAATSTAAIADVSAPVACFASPAVASSPPAAPPNASAATTTANNVGAGSSSDGGLSTLEFPFLALLVSGGHCQLLLCEGVGLYTVLGGTVDDALGEAYDKAARLLGLKVGGGGGPAVEALASKGDPTAVPLAVPMQSRKDLDFSFAGLKNSFRMAVTRAVEEEDDARRDRGGEAAGADPATEGGDDEKLSPAALMEKRGAALPESVRADLAASFQHTAIQHLEERVRRAMDNCEAIVARAQSASRPPPPPRSPPGVLLEHGIPPKLPKNFGETEFQSPSGGNFGEAEFQSASTSFGENEFRSESAGIGESFGDTDFLRPDGLKAWGRATSKAKQQEKGLTSREETASEKPKGVRALAVVGGVAANQELRRRLQALCDERKPSAWQMVVPPARLCTDNGVMVAWAAVERLREGMSNDPEGQEVYARLPLGRSAGDAGDGAASSS
eukprot:g8812.t1